MSSNARSYSSPATLQFALGIALIFAVSTFHLPQRTGWAQSANDSSNLIKQTQSGDESARIKAIEKLGQSAASVEAMDALRELYLGDDSEQIRRAARIALGKLKRKANKNTTAASAKSFAFSSTNKENSDENITAGIAAAGTFGFGVNYFSREDYVEPTPPTERVAKLIAQLQESPQSSIAASEQLAKLGDEAVSASRTLIEVMLRDQPAWHEARISATECLEKVYPQLQKPVWKIILENPSGANPSDLADIANLGPKGYAALPLLFAMWNAPEEKGYRVEPFVLATMHVVALNEPSVTEQVVRVLKTEVSVGGNCFNYAIDICDQRDLPADKIVELLTPVVLSDRDDFNVSSGAQKKLVQMVEQKKLEPEPVVKLFIRRIETIQRIGHAAETVIHLGHLGSAAKEALPLLRRLKFESQDQSIRKIAGEAMDLIDM